MTEEMELTDMKNVNKVDNACFFGPESVLCPKHIINNLFLLQFKVHLESQLEVEHLLEGQYLSKTLYIQLCIVEVEGPNFRAS